LSPPWRSGFNFHVILTENGRWSRHLSALYCCPFSPALFTAAAAKFGAEFTKPARKLLSEQLIVRTSCKFFPGGCPPGQYTRTDFVKIFFCACSENYFSAQATPTPVLDVKVNQGRA